ncbi:MAG: helix-turn-helix domain-containing protein [Oligoflexia bacterium]|nr:helix-turn-helix domain-containing protein [Oligoflexia bacterium]
MRKKKTLKKHEGSAKSTRGLKDFDTGTLIKAMSVNDLCEELTNCLKDKDAEAFKEILWSYLNHHNKNAVAKRMGVSRTTLYRMVSEDGNPTLDNIINLIDSIEKEAA